MAESTAQLAADWIWDAWQRGDVIDDLPRDLKPQTRDEGYAIQACLAVRQATVWPAGKSRQPVLQAKAISASTGRSPGGFSKPYCKARRDNPDQEQPHARCEPEFAFRLGDDIAPRDTPYSSMRVWRASVICIWRSSCQIRGSRICRRRRPDADCRQRLRARLGRRAGSRRPTGARSIFRRMRSRAMSPAALSATAPAPTCSVIRALR